MLERLDQAAADLGDARGIVANRATIGIQHDVGVQVNCWWR